MQDKSNIIKEAIEYRDKLEVKVKLQDEYIASLLLSLFLMEGEVNRLNQTLDLARKGELVFINNPQIKELKAENERLKEKILKWQTAYSRQYQINENKGYNKKEEQYRQTLQEIKAIAESAMAKQQEYKKDYEQILDLITKAESEG